MKTCPACHRPVADTAHKCPHAGCGKPLVAATSSRPAIRPPPPPPKISLAPADLSHPAQGGALGRPHRPGALRRLASTAALLALAVLFCGGIYYAAVFDRGAERPDIAQAPRGADNVAHPPSSPANPSSDRQDSPKNSAAPPSVPPSGKEPTKPSAADNEKHPAAGAKAETKLAAKPREPEVLGLYSQRTAPDREEWITQVGGTIASEQAVAAGLDWLARHQAPDGHWGPDCLRDKPNGQCEPGQTCSGQGGRYEAGLTGLAVLAFQAGGNYHFNERPYSKNVARALDYLLARQGLDGELVGTMSQPRTGAGRPAGHFDRCYMYEHGIATFALCEACALAKASRQTPAPNMIEAAARAVKFIESQQHADGGWRYTGEAGAPSDTSVSGWSMLALKSAREAEIAIDEQTMPRLVDFFEREYEPLTGRTHYWLSGFNTDALTGVGMLVDEFVLHKLDTRRIALGSAYLAEQAEDRWGPHKNAPADYYLWYNCTLAMFLAGGEPWQRWNAVVRDRVVSLQEKGEACRRGSWPPDDRWSDAGGRIYATALAVLTLEAYYRFSQERLIAEKPAN